MTSRTKALLGGAATVVVLAAVILGLWAFGSPKKNVPTITLSAQQRSAQALKDGRAALSKEQTQTAIQLFQTALTIDPGNTEAQSALNDVNSGKSASTNTGSSSTTKRSSTTTKTPAPPSVWTGDVDVSGLLPTAFPNYIVGATQAGDTEAAVSASPSKPGATVTSIVWTVHDRGSATKAKEFVTKVSKVVYPQDNATVVVNDVTNAFFGTDGKQFATISFVRGRYVFELVITSSKTPSAEKTFATQAAAAFATSP